MLKRLYSHLTSLNLGLWLLTGVMLALVVGSFSRGASESGGLNDMPLWFWLTRAPLSYSWWLWIAVALMVCLCLNTLLCTIEALKRKGRRIAPHLMHAGFLLIVLAHLFSAVGSFKDRVELAEGGALGFPDGERVRVEKISGEVGAMGMLSSYQANVRLENGKLGSVQPNHPLFHKGYGIYLKEVALEPMPVALFEIHREPGAIPALLGALLFTAGNLMLLAQRRKK